MRGAVHHCDLLIVGGGIAGSTLAHALAQGGAHVLVVEKETAYRDRVRGEVLLRWGSVEAKALGIYDHLLASCAWEAPRQLFFLNGEATPPRDYRTSTPRQTGALSFYHPNMQEELARRARSADVEFWRGATLRTISPGDVPEAEISVGGKLRRVRTRLIVGADGRESIVAAHLGLERGRTPQGLFITGAQLTGPLEIETALYFFLQGHSGRGSILIRNGPQNHRVYLLHHKDALPRRPSGARDYDLVLTQLREIGVPAEWLAATSPYGILASFDGAFQWVTMPVRGNCVLIGDAAATTDPVWGNGLSRTLRDVRLLSERLLGDRDWTAAAAAYAADHDDFFHRLRRAEQLNTTLMFSMGDAAEERRKRAFKLMDQYPDLSPDVTGLGPEARCTEQSVKMLLNA